LGYTKSYQSQQIAADVLNQGFGKGGVTLMCVLVMISALGAVNGLIFTGARVYSTIGKDHAVLSWMSGWDRQHGAPVPALITQGVLALALIFLVGTQQGREAINSVLDLTATTTVTQVKEVDGQKIEVTEKAGHWLKPIKWQTEDPSKSQNIGVGLRITNLAKDGFDTLLTCTAPIFWAFFLLTGVSLFVLRERDHHIERPFKVPFYPELPLIFCISCSYMLYSSLTYALIDKGWAGGVVLLGVVPLVVGLPLYRLSQLMKQPVGTGVKG
jgi:APA family basic amino acid/polyamine antiporter